MPAPATCDDLVSLIERSKLIEATQLARFVEQHPECLESPKSLAEKLRDEGLLTQFHTEQLLKGKHRGYFLGKYKLLHRIGMGGMGQVFLAEHIGMYRRAALKVLPPDMASNSYSRERFFREARAAGQLDHPNLVRAFDVDTDKEIIFLVMEHIDGISMQDLIEHTGPINPARAANYILQAAEGLRYIWTAGLIHRDIKPANMLLDHSWTVKILDLGLVRSIEDDNELTKGQGVKMLGTADYLSPEQAIDCSAVDIRADLYSLGATAYYLLSGKPPFPAERVSEKLIAHQMKIAPRLDTVRPEIPSELADIVAKLMAKKPEERYQTPEELIVALQPWAIPPMPSAEEEEAMAKRSMASVNRNSLSFTKRNSSSTPIPSQNSAIRYYGFPTPPPVGSSKSSTPFPSRPGISITPPPVPMKSPSGSLLPPILPASTTHQLKSEPVPTPVQDEPDAIPLLATSGDSFGKKLAGYGLAATVGGIVIVALMWGLGLMGSNSSANSGVQAQEKQPTSEAEQLSATTKAATTGM